MTLLAERFLPLATPDDLAGLRGARGAGSAPNGYRADAGQAQSAVLHPLVGDQAPAVAMRLVTPALEAVQSLKAGEPWLLAAFHPAKEVLERQIQALEGDLLGMGVEAAKES